MTDEERRILWAAREGRLSVNQHGRYVIEGEPRPARKDREMTVKHYLERCPRCHGKGTIVQDGPHDDMYDSHYPCPRCTTDRTALRGTGWVPVAHEERRA